MKNVVLLIGVESGVGLPATALGVHHMYQQHGYNARIFWPSGNADDPVTAAASISPVFSQQTLSDALANEQVNELLETLVEEFDKQTEGANVVCVLGVPETNEIPQAKALNIQIAKTLDARVILVESAAQNSVTLIDQRLRLVLESYQSVRERIDGVILNKIGIPVDRYGHTRPDLAVGMSEEEVVVTKTFEELKNRRMSLPVLGAIPWNKMITRNRVIDIDAVCDVDFLNTGEALTRRISWLMVATRTVDTLAAQLKANTLIVVAGDRVDVLMMAALAEIRGVKPAGLLLTSDVMPSQRSLDLIGDALASGLPVMLTSKTTYEVISSFSNLYINIPPDDEQRFNDVAHHVAENLDHEKLKQLATKEYVKQLSPAAFRYRLVKRAVELSKRIVLPEGDEPRTIEAANSCAERGIAKPVLLGNPDKIRETMRGLDIEQHPNLEIIDTEEVYERYIDELVDLRKHKGMNPAVAAEILRENTIMLGTMMLHRNEVDGLVAGAVNTTAATVAPALQVIKTKPGQALVSSCFFMCLPDQVMVYADCAINPDPTAEQLADIAVQSAHSAKIFGIDPKVAMISYSTGRSGSGADVDKVCQATELAKEKIDFCPVDGPLQYDAATVLNVAKSKAPDSEVAGKATVFVFPDLNTGNTTYKAVQRSAGVISIGPMLQGLNKPVNDLSRGALVDDIIYTIALTAIQAGE